MAENKHRHNRMFWQFFLLLILLIGVIVLFYPFVSQYLYSRAADAEIEDFVQEAAKIPAEEIEERFKQAQLYNQTVDYRKVNDPWTDAEEEARAEYARMIQIHEKIGYVEIPKIHQNLPIYAGTSESVLQKGVGHMEETALPIGGINTHSVLTAHRGLPTARLFTDLDAMVEGDIFYVHNMKETLAYEVDRIIVVEPDEIEEIAIIDEKDYVTLLTCTPLSINSHRLLVRGIRISYTAPVDEDSLLAQNNQSNYRLLFYGVLTLIILIIVVMVINRRAEHKNLLEGDSFEK